MKKIILLTTALFSSVSVYGACTPPTDLKCQCQHPIIDSVGKLACGEDYCAKVGKKCMPNGSCCPEANFCQVGSNKYCCSDSQTCDTSTGCVEKKADIETLCQEAEGNVYSHLNEKFCVLGSGNPLTWYETRDLCLENNMVLAGMDRLCPSWTGSGNYCAEWTSPSQIANGVIGMTFAWSGTVVDGKALYFQPMSQNMGTATLDTILGGSGGIICAAP